jgi:outer membrane lipoprotein-sorting protein
MRRALLGIWGLMFFAVSINAQNADSIINKYIAQIGGMEKLQAVKSIRTTMKFTGGGGFQAVIINEAKRPNKTREEFHLQGMIGVSAYDGKNGWKIEPWQGKKDAEAMSEDELKAYMDNADFDDSLINYKERGIKVEYLGMDTVDGTDTYKLRATLPSGTVKHYYMDTDYHVPIKVEVKRMIRGMEVESESIMGDYKEVGGIYYAHSVESGAKGSPNKATITIEKIEVNVPIDDNRFVRPAANTQQMSPTKMDASMEKPNQKKTEDATKKPPQR